jgi:hypothetical protein
VFLQPTGPYIYNNIIGKKLRNTSTPWLLYFLSLNLDILMPLKITTKMHDAAHHLSV